ncbi:MAG: sugar transferase [Janthinobacterium lividum]
MPTSNANLVFARHATVEDLLDSGIESIKECFDQNTILSDSSCLTARAESSLIGHARWFGDARTAKLALDFVLAFIILMLISPVFIVIYIACRLDGGGALFAHQRVGANGQSFPCLKFRTMVIDSDRVLQDALECDPELASMWAATRKLRNDPRVTPIGRFLRASSLDELPQLINILRGEMSLVGPRPIVESEVPFYGDKISHYYAVRPGLTGLWQVSGRSNTSYDRRVELDVSYVTNWTFRSDVAILLKTVSVVIAQQGAY